MKVAFLGDIGVFSDGLLSSNWKKGLKEVANILREYDLVVANLETPLTNRKKTMTCKGIHLKSVPEVTDILKYLNVSLVCLANNHICDFGKKGMEETIAVLDKAKINYFGVNNKVHCFEYDNNNLIFGGFCCYSTNGTNYINHYSKKGVNALTKKNITDFLDTAKRKNQLGILSLHWGDEYSRYVNEKQVSLMHELSHTYKFILHGHHAHALQAIEKYNHSLLAYNLGNFCFDNCISPINNKIKISQSSMNKESFILEVSIIDNQVVDYSTRGIYYDDYHIKLIDNRLLILDLKNKIKECSSERYKQMSCEMIKEQKNSNLLRHDWKWLISKLNYYSIGAKILSYKNRFFYKKSY